MRLARRGLLLVALGTLGGCVRPAPWLPRSPTRQALRARLEALGERHGALLAAHAAAQARALVDRAGAAAEMQRAREEMLAGFEEAVHLLARQRRLVSPRRAELWRMGRDGLLLISDLRSIELELELGAILGGDPAAAAPGGAPAAPGPLGRGRADVDSPGMQRRLRRLRSGTHGRARPLLLELIQRRNALARERGLGTAWHAWLAIGQTDAGALGLASRTLVRTTRLPHARLLRELRRALGGRHPADWELPHALERVAPDPWRAWTRERIEEATARLLAAIGVSPGRAIGASPAPPAGFEPRGIAALGAALGARGRALAAELVTETSPLANGAGWVPGLVDPRVAEASAGALAGLAGDATLLTRALGLGPAEVRQIAARWRADALLESRRRVAAFDLARLAFGRDVPDLDRLSLQLEHRVLGVAVPRRTEPVWAASALLLRPDTAPARLAGLLAGAQLRAAMRARSHGWSAPPAAAGVLRDLVGDGARSRFDEKLLVSCRTTLGHAAFVREIVA